MVWIGSTTTAVNTHHLAPCPPNSYRKETEVNYLQQPLIGIDECISFPVSPCQQISMRGELGRSGSVVRGRFFCVHLRGFIHSTSSLVVGSGPCSVTCDIPLSTKQVVSTPCYHPVMWLKREPSKFHSSLRGVLSSSLQLFILLQRKISIFCNNSIALSVCEENKFFIEMTYH